MKLQSLTRVNCVHLDQLLPCKAALVANVHAFAEETRRGGGATQLGEFISIKS